MDKGLKQAVCFSCKIVANFIEGGESIDDFLTGFPTVNREQVIAFREEV